jgi:hypothetical protein
MQGIEAGHADVKVVMLQLTNGHRDCWLQVMQLDSISQVCSKIC